MSKKKNKKSKINPNSGKLLTRSLVIGLSIGTLLGVILLIVTDNLLYFGLAPISSLIIGLIVGSMLEKKNLTLAPVSTKSIKKK